MYKKLILGSPGTGKTTRLLEITEEKLSQHAPEKIAFFSFTKKAVREAIERATTKFELPDRRLRNFKTLHALAYRDLGINPHKMINYSHYKKIEQLTGFKLLMKNPTEDDLVEKGDQFLFLEGYARGVKKDYREIWQQDIIEDIKWAEFKLFLDTYHNYKEHYQLLDYTDWLEQYIIRCKPLNIDVAIIDEAQDLNPLQWDVVWHATQNAKEVYIAGDDDQAIYKWAGADVDQFLTLNVDEKEVLPISYRLPKTVYSFANDIVERIKTRYDKAWQPQDKAGNIRYHTDISGIDFTGGWLALARSNYQLYAIKKSLRERGYLYYYKGQHCVDEEHYQMIRAYVAKQNNRPVTDADFNLIKKYYNPMIEWFYALENISFYDREYYRMLLQQGIKLNAIPTIKIDTIHGSKGGEADNVLLVTDISEKVHNALMKAGDDEHRVFYVGATRAKKELHILMPQTSIYYDL